MVALNLSADSFWEPSRVRSSDLSARCAGLIEQGADIIDIGAVSTRPGAAPVSLEEEWALLEPALRALSELHGALLSIDTTRPEIVRRAYGIYGPFIVNDVAAGDDPEMLRTVAKLGLTYVAMHHRGTPRTMDALTDYGPAGVVESVKTFFREFSRSAEEFGIKDWILDPGFGFAKTDAQNIDLLRHLGEFKVFGRPILAGVADKRFTRSALLQELIENAANLEPSAEPDRAGTLFCERLAAENGASILRRHLIVAPQRRTVSEKA